MVLLGGRLRARMPAAAPRGDLDGRGGGVARCACRRVHSPGHRAGSTSPVIALQGMASVAWLVTAGPHTLGQIAARALFVVPMLCVAAMVAGRDAGQTGPFIPVGRRPATAARPVPASAPTHQARPRVVARDETCLMPGLRRSRPARGNGTSKASRYWGHRGVGEHVLPGGGDQPAVPTGRATAYGGLCRDPLFPIIAYVFRQCPNAKVERNLDRPVPAAPSPAVRSVPGRLVQASPNSFSSIRTPKVVLEPAGGAAECELVDRRFASVRRGCWRSRQREGFGCSGDRPAAAIQP
jgi:hypothetical protein